MNSYETVTGLVSREVDTGDADRYLVLLTAEAGKVECFAKGIRNQKSKLAASARILTFGEFKLFVSKERRILVSAKAIERFPGLALDIERYAYATHFLDIARDVIQEAQPFPEALQALLNSLFVLAYKDTAPSFVARVFELRTLSIAGFAPVLDRCSACGAPASVGVLASLSAPAPAGAPAPASASAPAGVPEPDGAPALLKGPGTKRFAFDVFGSGLVCADGPCAQESPRRAGYAYAPVPESAPVHVPEAASEPVSVPASAHASSPVPVSPGAVRAMRHVATCAAGEIFSFSVSDSVSRELARIVPAYLRSQLGREYPRLEEAKRYRAFEEEARYIASSRLDRADHGQT